MQQAASIIETLPAQPRARRLRTPYSPDAMREAKGYATGGNCNLKSSQWSPRSKGRARVPETTVAPSRPGTRMDQNSATPAELSHEELVERIGRGDGAAEQALVAKFSRGVMQMILRHAPEHADDVHQDTFRAILERLRESGIEEPAQLDRFIVRTARNILLTTQRSAARRPVPTAPETVARFADQTPGPFEHLTRERTAHCVRQLIAELPNARDRAILYSFYIEGTDKEQICAELDLDTLHFNRVLHRARERFRALALADNLHVLEFRHES